MSEIEISIIEKVKNELRITIDIDPFELSNLLYEERNNSHPDKYQDKETKDAAEEKFKTLSVLFRELNTFLSKTRLERKAGEIALYQEKYELLDSKKKIMDLENEIIKFKSEISSQNLNIEKLNKKLDQKQSEELENSQHDLIDLYKPKKASLVIASASAFLLVVVTVISNLSTIKNKIEPISPIDTKYLSYILFIILIFVIINMLIRHRKQIKVKNISEELISTNAIKKFHDYHVEEEITYYTKKYFMESSVTEYIKYNFLRRRYKRSLIYYYESLFIIDDYKSINHLKDIFIFNLISKKLIEIGNTKDLERRFNVK